MLCRPLEHYPESKIYKECRHFQQYAQNKTNESVGYLRDHTFAPGVRNLRQVYGSALDVKSSLFHSLNDVYQSVRSYFTRVVDTTTDTAKEYCDAGLHKVNALVDQVKRERETLLGNGHALKPNEELELQIVSES
jgi:hypothetical protein